MSSWYGWIPILTPRILFAPMAERVSDAARSFALVSGNDVILPLAENLKRIYPQRLEVYFPDDFCRHVRDGLRCESEDRCFCFAYSYDDSDSRLLKRVAIRVDQQGIIRGTAICAWQHVRIESLTADCDISPQGLVHYSLELPGYAKQHERAAMITSSHARHHFVVIRNFYHEHVHHDGDFSLFPTEADDESKALHDLSDQLMTTIVRLHKFISDRLRRVATGQPSGYTSYEEMHTGLCKMLSSATGHLSYCEHFHALFPEAMGQHDLEPSRATLEPARNSLRALRDMEDILVAQRNVRPYDRVMLLVAAASSSVALYILLKDILLSLSGVTTSAEGWAAFKALLLTISLVILGFSLVGRGLGLYKKTF